jgi:hypothetical protein
VPRACLVSLLGAAALLGCKSRPRPIKALPVVPEIAATGPFTISYAENAPVMTQAFPLAVAIVRTDGLEVHLANSPLDCVYPDTDPQVRHVIFTLPVGPHGALDANKPVHVQLAATYGAHSTTSFFPHSTMFVREPAPTKPLVEPSFAVPDDFSAVSPVVVYEPVALTAGAHLLGTVAFEGAAADTSRAERARAAGTFDAVLCGAKADFEKLAHLEVPATPIQGVIYGAPFKVAAAIARLHAGGRATPHVASIELYSTEGVTCATSSANREAWHVAISDIAITGADLGIRMPMTVGVREGRSGYATRRAWVELHTLDAKEGGRARGNVHVDGSALLTRLATASHNTSSAVDDKGAMEFAGELDALVCESE